MEGHLSIPGVEIRLMDIHDYEEVVCLWNGTREIRMYSMSDSKPAIRQFLKMNPDTCFVAVLNERIVGSVLGGFDGRRAYIYHLVVGGKQQGRRIGSVLVEKLKKAMKAKGVDKIHIFVPIQNNKTSMAFWESLGWKPRSDIQMMSAVLTEPTESLARGR